KRCLRPEAFPLGTQDAGEVPLRRGNRCGGNPVSMRKLKIFRTPLTILYDCSTLSHCTTFVYNGANKLTTITEGGVMTTYPHDDGGRTISKADGAHSATYGWRSSGSAAVPAARPGSRESLRPPRCQDPAWQRPCLGSSCFLLDADRPVTVLAAKPPSRSLEDKRVTKEDLGHEG
ncbi:MAG: hypothetical protein RLZZ303_3366, partial [Candidatus Hydrogenedentota bacterium]